jgi:hypothetical protein
MKLEINEVYFVKESIKSITIKASDAPAISKLMEKLDKEFERLQKLEEAKE